MAGLEISGCHPSTLQAVIFIQGLQAVAFTAFSMAMVGDPGSRLQPGDI